VKDPIVTIASDYLIREHLPSPSPSPLPKDNNNEKDDDDHRDKKDVQGERALIVHTEQSILHKFYHHRKGMTSTSRSRRRETGMGNNEDEEEEEEEGLRQLRALELANDLLFEDEY